MRVLGHPPGLSPRMGAGTAGSTAAHRAARPANALKFHRDNALTGPQSGLYCAPLAAEAARSGAAASGLDEVSAWSRAQ